MRWESLRTTADGGAELPLELPEPSRERGTGRAGLAVAGAAPVAAGTDEQLAVEIRAKSIINKVPSQSRMAFEWTINPYRGCSHACVYCFARSTHTYLDLDAGRDFDTKIMVKVNAGELTRKELSSPRWTGAAIAMGTNTDPYQRAEGRYRLMREIIAALRDHANPFSILTKGTLILRDLDLIGEAAQRAPVSVAVSVGSTDEALWRSVEPGTPSPARRLDVVRRFADAGIGCSVLMAPILPGLSDAPDQLDRTVAAIAAAGARSVTPLLLHLRPGAREWYRAWLQREHPHLVPRYDELYRYGSYLPKAYQRMVTDRVYALARQHGIGSSERSEFRRPEGEPPAQPQDAQPVQLSLSD
ncbi:MAG: radical SAM protein [Streptosporangiales bacterium]|nr:radical SAM protein [Streptosporangiales bacterium]